MLVATPFIMNAQTENAILFDNIDDYVMAPAASPLIANSNALSITFWVLPLNTAPAFPDYDGFAGFRNNTDADFYILQLTTTGVEARFRNSAGTAYDIVYNGLLLNTAQHFAMTYDGSTLSLYHNGTFASSIPASGNISNLSEAFYIGMLPWPGDNFFTNGRLDEVSLWNKALSPTEISCIYSGAIDPSDVNLKLYYKFNQGIAGGNNTAITSLLDSKGNINGTFTGLALNGNTSNFVNGVTTPNSSTVNAFLCPGSTYIFGTQTITAVGTYYEAFPGSGLCDSIVQLILTGPNINTSISQVGPALTAQQTGAVYQWIDCTNGNAVIPGATNQTYTATANGQYAVIVTLGGCADTSVCATVTNVGIADYNNSFIQIQPNPFENELVIKNTHTDETFNIAIRDISGRIIEKHQINTGNTVRISTEQWSAGTYIVSDELNGVRVRCVKF